MVTPPRRFLDVEITGSSIMHFNTVRLMVPYFVTSDPIHYAKASHIYLRQMYRLPSKMAKAKVDFDMYPKG